MAIFYHIYSKFPTFFTVLCYIIQISGVPTKSKNAFRFSGRNVYKFPYSSFASKHGHSFILSHGSTTPFPFVSGEKSRCP